MEMPYHEREKGIKLNIGYYRRLRGISQEELAERVDISRTHMGNLELPKSNAGVTLDMLYRIAHALDIDITKLLDISKYSELH